MADESVAAGTKAPAVSRAAAALRLLGRSAAPLGVQAVARELALSPSTCLYLLRALVAEELVSFDPATKRYSLGPGVLTLARQWLRRSRFADLAQPALDRLSQQLGLTVLGVQIAGLDHITVVALSQAGPSLQLTAEIGSRFPALISATGRCIAAFGEHPPAELKRRFARLRWANPPSFEDWRVEVEETRRLGVAVDRGAYIAGVTVLSAPVWQGDAQAPTHALVATALGAGPPLAGEEEASAAILAAARTLSRQLSQGRP